MLVSVVVPIYNMEKFIAKTVACLRSQICGVGQQLEFLLINDGSTDRTLEIIQEQNIDQDSRFRLVTTENQGYGNACNLGFRIASGDYVSIYEPDDLIADDFYSTLMDYALKFPEADLLRYRGVFKISDNTRESLYSWDPEITNRILEADAHPRFWKSHTSVFNGMYRRDFITRSRIQFCDTPKASYQDVTFMVSLYYAKPRILVIDDVKYSYVNHPLQSIKGAPERLRLVFQNWMKEKKWLCEQGVEDFSFFNYRMVKQYRAILSVNPEIDRDMAMRAVRRLLNNRCMRRFPPISTLKEKLSWSYFSLKARRFRRGARRRPG